MCSELFRIPLDWLNAPVMGGISVAMLIALAIAVGIVKLLAWGRKTNRWADALGYIPGLVIIAAALLLLPRFVSGIPIRGYGVMVLLGSVTGLLMAVHRARQMNLSAEVIYSLAFGMFICGIIGARLFFVIEYWETRFQYDDWRRTLVEIVKFTEGGLVVYGSFIGATLAFLIFCRRQQLSPFAMSDLIAPSLLAGLALGRIGCLLNGCCYGGESSVPWAVTFPRESPLYFEQAAAGQMLGLRFDPTIAAESPPVIAAVVEDSRADQAGLQAGMTVVGTDSYPITNLRQLQELLVKFDATATLLKFKNDAGQSFSVSLPKPRLRSLPVHPTQVYSAVHAALLAWVLWSFYPFRRRDGEVTALMLTIYPISRFLLEIIRTDESAVFGTGLSISQNISIVLLVLALALWVYLRRQEPYRAVLAVEAASGRV
ncbi:MAG: prolipoprotein diacylglyceryl transferase family protein [Bythopirellula sp.]